MIWVWRLTDLKMFATRELIKCEFILHWHCAAIIEETKVNACVAASLLWASWMRAVSSRGQGQGNAMGWADAMRSEGTHLHGIFNRQRQTLTHVLPSPLSLLISALLCFSPLCSTPLFSPSHFSLSFLFSCLHFSTLSLLFFSFSSSLSRSPSLSHSQPLSQFCSQSGFCCLHFTHWSLPSLQPVPVWIYFSPWFELHSFLFTVISHLLLLRQTYVNLRRCFYPG